jgi:predicted acetyltransferase
MRVEIVPVPLSEKPLLWDHFQRYCSELMPFGNFAPVDGVFEYKRFDLYWREPDRFAFWATADGTRAAFALVHRGPCSEMAEFYSFPDYRRTGVALDFARQILKRFPGPWEISEYRGNTGAVSFWHRVIADYPFQERNYIGQEGKERLSQTFIVP